MRVLPVQERSLDLQHDALAQVGDRMLDRLASQPRLFDLMRRQHPVEDRPADEQADVVVVGPR
jgi:hypothetical protein